MTDRAFKAMSVEEYLLSEAKSPVKREYVAGFVYPLHAQAGVSRKHSAVAGNIFAALHSEARKQKCRLHLADMRLRIEDKNAFYTGMGFTPHIRGKRPNVLCCAAFQVRVAHPRIFSDSLRSEK